MRLDSTRPLAAGGAMPVIGLGTWQLTDDTADTVATAINMGYRMIDTSGDYGTQPGVGEGIRRSGATRDQLFIVTKIEEDDDAYAATCTNLEELGLDYADLVLIHRPPETGAGAELFGGLQQARDDSLVRRIGVSNYGVDLIDDLAAESGEMPAVNQVEWSPFGWNPEVLAACQQRGILVQAYSPLTRAKRLADTTLTRVANRHSRSPGQVLLRWHLQIGVVPLPKASSIEHLGQNARIFDFELSASDMDELGGLNEHWSALSNQPLHA